MKNNLIYKLTKDDVQAVANDILDRDLTDIEIEKIKNKIAENINWYDAIENAINDTLID